jgi:hypothetical protein
MSARGLPREDTAPYRDRIPGRISLALSRDAERRRHPQWEVRVMRPIASVCLILTLALAACGGSGTAVSPQSSPTPGPSASSSAAMPSGSPIGAALPAELIGTWSVLLGQADVATIANHVPGFSSAGVWTLTLSANIFQLFNPDEFTAGPVAAGIDAGKHLLVANDPDCPGQVLQTGGVYTYQASATSLTFSPGGDDACPFRGWLLRAKLWTKA